MSGVSTGGGDVYGKDVITSGKENSGKLTFTFTRQYRNQITQFANWQAATPVNAFTESSNAAGWYVLPIQNAWTAALKPRDVAAMDQLFKSYSVDSIGVQLSQMNIVETNATVNQVQDTTIPNLVMEMYIDNDHDLPGYNEDFLTEYGTNNNYTTSDIVGTTIQEADIKLKPYKFLNTNIYGFNPAIELNLLGNGPGFKMMTQNEDFSFNWDVKNGKKRHTFLPWQYQQNPEYRSLNNAANYPRMVPSINEARQVSNYTSSSGGWYSPNAAAGSFPGGADNMRINGSGAGAATGAAGNPVGVISSTNTAGNPVLLDTTVNLYGIHRPAQSQLPTRFYRAQVNPSTASVSCDGTVGAATQLITSDRDQLPNGTTPSIIPATNGADFQSVEVLQPPKANAAPAVPYVETAAGQRAEYGLVPPEHYGAGGDYLVDQDGTWVDYYNVANRDQITGLPFIGDIPPLILLRPQIRSTNGLSTVEFIVKFRITISGERNVLGFYPLPIDPANTTCSTWCGTGNLGFQTRPGVNRYRANQPGVAIGPTVNPYQAVTDENVPALQNPCGTPWNAAQQKEKVRSRPGPSRVEKLKALHKNIPYTRATKEGGVWLPSGAVGFVSQKPVEKNPLEEEIENKE